MAGLSVQHHLRGLGSNLSLDKLQQLWSSFVWSKLRARRPCPMLRLSAAVASILLELCAQHP